MDTPFVQVAPAQLRQQPAVRATMFVWIAFAFAAPMSAAGAYLWFSYQEDRRATALALAALPPAPREAVAVEYGVWPALRDPDFFASVRDSLIGNKASFIEADLSSMRMRVYTGGSVAADVPIKTKGREGSWWETPSGLYRAGPKERTHFSKLGHVYMPYSINFQGNFYIHGWPYYPDGTPVSSAFSGGCIRLADEDAQIIFDLATEEMPILVYEQDFTADDFSYQIAPPEVSARSFLAADLRNNFLLLGSDERATRHTATLPKIVTALVASEYRNIEQEVRVPRTVGDGDTRFTGGASYRIYDLLWPLILEDSAPAAETIATAFSPAELRALTAKKLAAIGVASSTVGSPSGTDGESRTTAEDLFSLVKYVYNNRPFLLSLSSGTQRFAYDPPTIRARATHRFTDDGFVGGVVAGASVPAARSQAAATAVLFASSTPAVTAGSGRDAFAVFEISFREGTRPIAFIVLDSQDPVGDIERMHSYVMQRYH